MDNDLNYQWLRNQERDIQLVLGKDNPDVFQEEKQE
jgi:hypothetical protein